MTVTTYASTGRQEPFNPERVRQQLRGCYLCGRPVAVVGVLVPHTPTTRLALLRLRQHPVAEGKAVGMAYGLCSDHAANVDASCEQVEAVMLAAATKVVIQ